MTRVAIGFVCLSVLFGCVETLPQLTADQLRAQLSGRTVQLRRDGGPDPGEPEAFNMTFRASGAVTVQPVGADRATVRDGDVTISFPLGFEGKWDVRDGQLCIGRQGRLDCQPATVAGDILIVKDSDTGSAARGRLRPAG
jgi:hypothetical protein